MDAVRLVGLHGFTGSRHDWEPLATLLRRPILGIDLVGHGDADAPSDDRAYAADAMVAAARDGLGEPASPSIVMGYSMGGRVALRLALEHPEVVGALVLIGVNPGIEGATARSERIARDRALAARIETRGMAWFCDHWETVPAIQSQRAIPDAVRIPMQARRRANRPAGLAGALRGFGQGAVEPVWDRLGSIRQPTLLVTGAADPVYGAIADRMVPRMSRATHRIIAAAGHCAHLEAMDATAAAIDAFVGAVSE